MPRTTITLVSGIIEIDGEIPLDPFITAANELVTEVCTHSNYTDVRLELIERWLSAHFYAQRDPRMSSVGVGVSVSYQSRVDLGFKNTHYGQQAMRLDTAGNLAALDKKIEKGGGKVRGAWLGTPLTDVDVERM